MSFSERHARGEHGRFATGGTFSFSDGAIYADGWKLSDAKIIGGSFSTCVETPELPRRPSWRQPRRLWRWWMDRRRGVAWRNGQQTRTGTFTVRGADMLWARQLYRWLGVEPPPLASWPVRAIAKAITLRIVLRMVRGG